MNYGRCDILLRERQIRPKDYSLISYNFTLGDLIGNEVQLDLPQNVYFVMNTLSVLASRSPVNDGESRLQDLAFALLRGLSVIIKVKTKEDVVITPINRLPLDLFVSNDRINSITASETFNLPELLGTGILFSPEEDNLISIVWNVVDPFEDITKQLFPDVSEETLRAWHEDALKYLNTLQICLNGYFSKDLKVELVEEDVVDLVQKKERVALSYSFEARNRLFRIYCDCDADGLQPVSDVAVSKGVEVSLGRWKVSEELPPLNALMVSVVIPPYNKPLVLKDFGLVAFPFNKLCIAATAPFGDEPEGTVGVIPFHMMQIGPVNSLAPTITYMGQVSVFMEDKQYNYLMPISQLIGDDYVRCYGSLDKIIFDQGGVYLNNRVVGVRESNESPVSWDTRLGATEIAGSFVRKLYVDLDSFAKRAIDSVEEKGIKYEYPVFKQDFSPFTRGGLGFSQREVDKDGWIFVLPPKTTLKLTFFIPLKDFVIPKYLYPNNYTGSELADFRVGEILWGQGIIYLEGYLVEEE